MAMDKPWRVTHLSSFDAGGDMDSVYQNRAFLGGVIYGHSATSTANITVYDSALPTGDTAENPILVAYTGNDARSLHVDLSGAPIPMDNGIAFAPSVTANAYVTVIWAPRGPSE